MKHTTDFKCIFGLAFINKRLHRELNPRRCIYHIGHFPKLHQQYYLQHCEIFTSGISWLKEQLAQINKEHMPLVDMTCEGMPPEHQIQYMYEYIQDVLLSKKSFKFRKINSFPDQKDKQDNDGLDPEQTQ